MVEGEFGWDGVEVGVNSVVRRVAVGVAHGVVVDWAVVEMGSCVAVVAAHSRCWVGIRRAARATPAGMSRHNYAHECACHSH